MSFAWNPMKYFETRILTFCVHLRSKSVVWSRLMSFKACSKKLVELRRQPEFLIIYSQFNRSSNRTVGETGRNFTPLSNFSDRHQNHSSWKPEYKFCLHYYAWVWIVWSSTT